MQRHRYQGVDCEWILRERYAQLPAEGGKPVEAVISGIQVSTPQGASLSARLRKYWYREVDQK